MRSVPFIPVTRSAKPRQKGMGSRFSSAALFELAPAREGPGSAQKASARTLAAPSPEPKNGPSGASTAGAFASSQVIWIRARFSAASSGALRGSKRISSRVPAPRWV